MAARDDNEEEDRSRAGACARLSIVDELADSFPVLAGESQWLLTLMADELVRIMVDD